MNQKRIFWIILLFLIASLDVSMARQLQQSYGIQKQEPQLANEEEAFATLRAFELPPDAYRQLAGKEEASESANDKQQKELHENILAYLFCQSLQSSDLKDWKRLEKSARPGLYADYTEIVKKLLADAVWFPVPAAVNDEKTTVSYENSWQSERTYGGTRGHEGCDLMASVQQRGYCQCQRRSGRENGLAAAGRLSDRYPQQAWRILLLRTSFRIRRRNYHRYGNLSRTAARIYGRYRIQRSGRHDRQFSGSPAFWRVSESGRAERSEL